MAILFRGAENEKESEDGSITGDNDSPVLDIRYRTGV